MSKSAEKQCQHCGEMFMRRVLPWREKAGKFERRKFCSIPCQRSGRNIQRGGGLVDSEIIAKLMRHRKSNRMSQDYIAAFVNMERSVISDYERGTSAMRLKTALKWAEAVGLKLDLVQDRKPWSAEEITILRNLFPYSSWKELYQALPNRTRDAIRNKAKSLGISRAVKRKEWDWNQMRYVEREAGRA